ncbi:putative tyrosine phosphatase [carnivorous sponge associated iridovirus]|jgi:protein-tyrosine phosphatase|nr:putative tyrosine phosphatase [carnivorous sponge associated iridovirus]
MAFITETSAYFVPNQCLFGAYPTQHQIQQLEEWGVDIVVNLTKNDEKKIRSYRTKIKVIHFPIPDRKVPEEVREFCALVIHLTREIRKEKKIYIHCKGGHGRAGLLVSAILCYLHKITPRESFIRTSEYHATRPVHSTKPRKNEFWKTRGSPESQEQRDFVRNLFQPYKISKDSPFMERGKWLSQTYDTFLMNTNLGPIEGTNGEELEEHRDSLIEDMVFF